RLPADRQPAGGERAGRARGAGHGGEGLMSRAAILVAAGLAALVLAGASSSRPAGCMPGVRSAGGASYRTFCGPAHATLRAGGKTFLFRGGSCLVPGNYFTINIGTITLGADA